MKIYNINPFTPYFQGKRQDRKTVSQLQKDNVYDLNVINQRNISNAIENLANVPGEDNANFLLDVSENLKYGTNIDLGKQPYNDWRVKLNNAARKSIELSDDNVKSKLLKRLEKIENSPKDLNETELQILDLRKSILSKVDRDLLNSILNKNIKNLDRNIDYFIVSSEVPLFQKLYIMQRLNYFMSPDYKINPQLENQKTRALAEIVNDLVIDTPESKVPNIKAVNQKLHGMCAAISICRKALAYEDKVNYVDMILSELDDSDYLQVYDITKLGTHTKIPIAKADVDYAYALSKGYRIIDAAALNWMNVADTAGAANEFVGVYKPFDKENFDSFHDSHLTSDLDDSLVLEQDWYRSLAKAKDLIKVCKKKAAYEKYQSNLYLESKKENLEFLSKYTGLIASKLKEIAPNANSNKIHEVVTDLLNLEVPNAERAQKVKDYKRDFVYLPNETEKAKTEKIKAFLTIAFSSDESGKITDKFANELYNLLVVRKSFDKKSEGSYVAEQIMRAESLYNAAAAYRTQSIFKLDIPVYLQESIQKMNIPDEETLIVQNMDYLIKKLEKGTIDPKLRAILAKNFASDDDNEALAESLKGNKETVEVILKSMDDLYNCCLAVDKKTSLKNEIIAIKNAIEEGNDENVLLDMAEKLKVKDNKKKDVLEILDKYINQLSSENCTEKEYLTILNKIGHSSQLLTFKDTFSRLGEILFNEDNKNSVILQGFNLKNNLPKDAPIEETLKIYNRIGDVYNQYVGLIGAYQKALNIRNEDGEVLNTVNPKMIIIKKMENMGDVIPVRDLVLFRDKLSKIEYARTQSDESALKYDELPKELTTFTPREKAVMKHIEECINGWYSYTTRALDVEYKKLKEPLADLNRQAGIKTGRYWVGPEASSGLSSNQQVKLFEHMTDRPYYIENNGKYAVKKIKASPYSGVSSTSVYAMAPAWHAQYIADIRSLPVKTDDKVELKDAVFHDNTWGPREHRNTWVDENGLLRTDYSSNYGGSLGYITDDEYLTGKLVDNLLGEIGEFKSKDINNKNYRRLVSSSDYKFPMFCDIITPGTYPNPDKFVRQIRENTLIPSSVFMPQLESQVKSMTKSEVKALINKAETLSTNLGKEYSDYENRINGNKPFEKGIETKQDYDKLPDNDKLKILFEKMALIRSYKAIPDQKILFKENTMPELQKIKQQIKVEARKNFDYTFAKNIDIAKYGAESVREEVNLLLDNFAQNNHIKINNQLKLDVVNSLKNISKEKFDGSLDKTIDLMIESFVKVLNKKTPSFENKDENIEKLANGVRNLLRANMGFTLADLDSSSFASDSMKNIIDWIDATFDPSTDEELVQIINNLRNMTTSEFNQKYNDKITDQAIGIKKVTGYDVLCQFKNMDERTHNMLYNLLFNQRMGLNLKMSETTPVYDYNKLERKLRGAKYSNAKRSVDDLYLEYYYALKLLTLDKAYNRLSEQAFKMYRMFPGCPKYNFDKKENISNIAKKIYNDINDEIEAIDAYKVQDKSIKIINDLDKYINRISDNEILSKGQKKHITQNIKEFLELNGDDTSIQDTIDAANNLLKLDDSAKSSDYKYFISIMRDELNMYLSTADGKSMTDAVKISLESIKDIKQDILNLMNPKYRVRAEGLLNKWISAKYKNLPDADKYYQEFHKMLDKHIITRTPEEMLNQYLLLLAKPDAGETSETNKNTERMINSLHDDIRGLLYQASLLEMQHLFMSCASEANLNVVKDEFKKSKLQLKNGSIVSLDSDIAIDIMLAPLLADEDLDSAILFLEQLGLADRVVEMAQKNNSFDKALKNIKRINSILSSVSKQTSIVEAELNNLGNIDKDPNYKEKVKAMEERIVRKFKNTNYRISIKIIRKSFENALKEMEEHPERSKTALLYLHMEEAKSASIVAAKYNINLLNQKLMKIQKVKNLIVNLTLPEDSPANEARKKYLEDFSKLEEYIATQSKNFPNIDLSTQSVETEDDLYDE